MSRVKRLNLFTKSSHSFSEEDRATNGLLFLLDYFRGKLLSDFFTLTGIDFEITDKSNVEIRDQVSYGKENRIDGEIKVDTDVCIAVETKIFRNNFVDSDQLARYFEHLKSIGAKSVALVALSPDYEMPPEVNLIKGQSENLKVVWISWEEIRELLLDFRNENLSVPLIRFLVDQYTDYLKVISVVDSDEDAELNTDYKTQMKAILGNDTVEKVLLHIFHFGESHATKISRDWEITLNMAQGQLKRLHEGGILKRRRVARACCFHLTKTHHLQIPLFGW